MSKENNDNLYNTNVFSPNYLLTMCSNFVWIILVAKGKILKTKKKKKAVENWFSKCQILDKQEEIHFSSKPFRNIYCLISMLLIRLTHIGVSC